MIIAEILFFIFILLIVLSILFLDILTLFDVDWKNKWRDWIKEFFIMYIIFLLLTIGINHQCVEMIETVGFTKNTIIQILFNSTIFTLVCLPWLNFRNNNWK